MVLLLRWLAFTEKQLWASFQFVIDIGVLSWYKCFLISLKFPPGVGEEGKARNGNQWYIHIKMKRTPGASCQNCEVTGVMSFLIFSWYYSLYLRCLMLNLKTVIYNGTDFTWNTRQAHLMDKGVIIIYSGVSANRGGAKDQCIEIDRRAKRLW